MGGRGGGGGGSDSQNMGDFKKWCDFGGLGEAEALRSRAGGPRGEGAL